MHKIWPLMFVMLAVVMTYMVLELVMLVIKLCLGF